MSDDVDARLATLAEEAGPDRRDQVRAVKDLMLYQLPRDGCHTYGRCDCGRMTSRGCGWCLLCLAEMLARLGVPPRPRGADDGD